MLLYISIPIEFYNGIVLFELFLDLCNIYLQTAVNYPSKVTTYRKNESDRIVNEVK